MLGSENWTGTSGSPSSADYEVVNWGGCTDGDCFCCGRRADQRTLEDLRQIEESGADGQQPEEFNPPAELPSNEIEAASGHEAAITAKVSANENGTTGTEKADRLTEAAAAIIAAVAAMETETKNLKKFTLQCQTKLADGRGLNEDQIPKPAFAALLCDRCDRVYNPGQNGAPLMVYSGVCDYCLGTAKPPPKPDQIAKTPANSEGFPALPLYLYAFGFCALCVLFFMPSNNSLQTLKVQLEKYDNLTMEMDKLKTAHSREIIQLKASAKTALAKLKKRCHENEMEMDEAFAEAKADWQKQLEEKEWSITVLRMAEGSRYEQISAMMKSFESKRKEIAEMTNKLMEKIISSADEEPEPVREATLGSAWSGRIDF